KIRWPLPGRVGTLGVGMGSPIIFWTDAVESDRASLEEARNLYGAQVVHVTADALARHALGAISRGPVVCIVVSDKEAGHALGLGVDEVLRAGEVTREALAGAISRAGARAAVRASPEYRHALLDQDEEAAFAQLGAAFGERLETPLALASVDCAAVAEAMNCLIEVDDQFFAWTALVAPSEQLRNLVARRLTAPTAPELRGVLKRLRASIVRAESLVHLLRDLTKSGESGSTVAVSPLLADIVDVMRPVISPWAEISVQADPDCIAAASRTTLVVVVGVLLSSALDSIRAASRGKGSVLVRVFDEEDAVIIEVKDDGREIPSDLRPDVLEAQFGTLIHRRGIPGLRDRVRRAGGEVLVDSGSTGSMVRVFLPSARIGDGIGLETLGKERAPSFAKTES
ncbi:MAG TPA: ATP-binding protein, partial [Polyangiaceae bacterium]